MILRYIVSRIHLYASQKWKVTYTEILLSSLILSEGEKNKQLLLTLENKSLKANLKILLKAWTSASPAGCSLPQHRGEKRHI